MTICKKYEKKYEYEFEILGVRSYFLSWTPPPPPPPAMGCIKSYQLILYDILRLHEVLAVLFDCQKAKILAV